MAYYLNVDRFGNEIAGSSTPYVVYAHSPAALAVPTTLGTPLANFGTTVTNNTGTAWNATAGTFTCPRAGFYEVCGQVEWQSTAWTAGTIFATGVTRNGTNVCASRQVVQANHTAGFQTSLTCGIVQLAVGDIIRLSAFQATGGVRTSSATIYTSLSIHEII